jgi:uracil-DNA glycosylase family 4
MALNPEARAKVWLPLRNPQCTLCPLHETANSVCLLGDGPVPCKVMLIGEAPGAREDDIAKPFSGPAGQYLNRILEEVGLPRSTVYITNAARCRPPDNRTPTKKELKACSIYMAGELETVRPDYILLLGNTALQAILNTSGVMSKRGIAVQQNGRTVFTTVHPAAVLRNPGLEGSFRADLMAFARLVRGEDRRPETKSAIIQSSKGLAKLCSMLEAVDTPIAFDVETGSSDPTEDQGGLHPWSPDGIVHTVAFCWEPGRSYVVSLEHPATQWDIPIERVYGALNIALAGKKMVGHNVKFDAAWMKAKGVNLYCHFDTKYAAHLLEENRPQGLKSLARTYLGADDYESGIHFGAEAGQLVRLAIYNGKDADYTLRLYHIFREELKKQPRLLRLFMQLAMPATRAFVEIEANGFPVDVKRLEERHREAKQTIERITQEMLEYVPEEKRGSANFRSPVFLGWWFFEHLGLPILERGAKSGRPSTNESVLLRLRKRHPAVDKLMELRKWQKYESTYTRNWIIRVKRARKPRLYTSYNLSGTVTGRLSSDMQQVPRDLFIRSIIGSRPGWKFIEADFSQIELRIAAMLSGDKTLTRAFNAGEDPHATTAWTVDPNAALRAAELLRLWAGVSTDGAGVQVLCKLLKHKKELAKDQTIEVYLRSLGRFWKDTKSRGRVRRQSERGIESHVEGWDFSSSVPEVLKEAMRAMREYEISSGTPFGSQQEEQRPFKPADVMQILSSTPSSQREELFPEWKEHRKKAKAVGFGFLYGMGARKFKVYAKEKYGVEVTDEEAQAYRRAFFDQYASLLPWHDRQRRIVRNLASVTSPIGRVRHLPAINSTDDMVVGEAEREAINSPVQGLAADLTVLSMVQLQATLDPRIARVIGNVHDSIMLEVREEHAEEVAAQVKHVMENLPLKKMFGWSPTVPIEAEVSVGQHWGES